MHPQPPGDGADRDQGGTYDQPRRINRRCRRGKETGGWK
jgi:hypothetical protein